MTNEEAYQLYCQFRALGFGKADAWDQVWATEALQLDRILAGLYPRGSDLSKCNAPERP